jgi:two-component system chemotaxis sensor kinase CheA
MRQQACSSTVIRAAGAIQAIAGATQDISNSRTAPNWRRGFTTYKYTPPPFPATDLLGQTVLTDPDSSIIVGSIDMPHNPHLHPVTHAPPVKPDKGKVDDLAREFLAESQEGLDRVELCLTELEHRPYDTELIAEIFRAVHTIKGTTGFLGLLRLQKLAHVGEALLVELREGRIIVTPPLINGLLAMQDGLRGILNLIAETGTEGERSDDDDRELIALLVSLKTQAAVSPPPASAHDLEAQSPARTSLSSSSASTPSLRIDVDVLNRMMNLVGELVLTRNQLLESKPGQPQFPDLKRRLSNVTTELRESVRQARLQPLWQLFGKFPRIVRDLAHTCGREVRIEFEGQDTRLDKSLLDAIRDPLTHAVRNAVDHGIEPPAERLKAGKPAEGVVRLRASQQGAFVVIEVTDDGAGISTERVLRNATERGLINASQAASMGQREALQMIFVAGFSTAREVTAISGRGVGMDVVRTNVETIGGTVEVESQLGAGTTIRLRIPLTLAIVPALIVGSAGHCFALPRSALTELVYVTHRDMPLSIQSIGSAEVYRLRDTLLPLVRLDQLLGLPASLPNDSATYIAVLEDGTRRFGLVLDTIRTAEEIVVKPLSSILREIGVFSGATMLGNGELALILDASAIAIRAGVRPEPQSTVTGKVELDSAALNTPTQTINAPDAPVVLYESAAAGSHLAQIALPLSAVERIVRIRLSDVEYADGHPVVQYEGTLLALEDHDLLLEAANATTTALVTVLICVRHDPANQPSRVGIVVRRVLGVSDATLLARNPDLGPAQVAMVNQRVATLDPRFCNPVGVPSHSVLQEVA